MALLPELSLVDRSSDLPLHVQVRRRVLEMIQKSPPDAPLLLPSEAELMRTFGVSRITVRRALQDLAAAGYVRRQAGKGSFALPHKLRHTSGRIGGASEEFKEQGFAVTARVLEYSDRVPPPEVAVQLGLGEGEAAPFVHRLMIVDGKPISVVHIYFNLPNGIRPTAEDAANESVISVLRRKWGIVPTRGTRTMEAALASQEDLELLELDPPAPVLIVDLVGFDDSDRGLFHVNVRYDSALYKYVQEIELPPNP